MSTSEPRLLPVEAVANMPVCGARCSGLTCREAGQIRAQKIAQARLVGKAEAGLLKDGRGAAVSPGPAAQGESCHEAPHNAFDFGGRLCRGVEGAGDGYPRCKPSS